MPNSQGPLNQAGPDDQLTRASSAHSDRSDDGSVRFAPVPALDLILDQEGVEKIRNRVKTPRPNLGTQKSLAAEAEGSKAVQ